MSEDNWANNNNSISILIDRKEEKEKKEKLQTYTDLGELKNTWKNSCK